MVPRSRLHAPIAAIVAALLVACGATAAPSGSTDAVQPPVVSSSATPDPAARDAYSEAMCAIFAAIIALDPRIGHVRDMAGVGGDMSSQADEMTSLSEAMLPLLNDLEAVPDWEPGRVLRQQLIAALHGIRTTFLSRGARSVGPGGRSDDRRHALHRHGRARSSHEHRNRGRPDLHGRAVNHILNRIRILRPDTGRLTGISSPSTISP